MVFVFRRFFHREKGKIVSYVPVSSGNKPPSTSYSVRHPSGSISGRGGRAIPRISHISLSEYTGHCGQVQPLSSQMNRKLMIQKSTSPSPCSHHRGARARWPDAAPSDPLAGPPPLLSHPARSSCPEPSRSCEFKNNPARITLSIRSL